MTKTTDICEKIYREKSLNFSDFNYLMDLSDFKELNEYARKIALKNFSNKIYIRGLIEFSTYCKNDCYYCGLRKSNKAVNRLRLTKSQILSCVKRGVENNIHTIVLQGGEDPEISIDFFKEVIGEIKSSFPQVAITISAGEMDLEDYKILKDLGTDRYLLRHETASIKHYNRLHPKSMSYENRINSLKILRELGFQTGCGMMVGSPFQTRENLFEDLLFIREFKPHMVGLGPFIPNEDTPFKSYPQGKLEDVLKILSIVRLLDEKILLPATTALGTIHPTGREMGILAGANVLMPNIGEDELRKNYKLYNNKIGTELENEDDYNRLDSKLKTIGYEISTSRGDY